MIPQRVSGLAPGIFPDKSGQHSLDALWKPGYAANERPPGFAFSRPPTLA